MAEANYRVAVATEAIARAALEQAEAVLFSAKTNLDYTTIRSPVDGTIIDRRVNIGQTVQLTATLYDQHNNVLIGRTVTWSSSDATKATVSTSGLVTALKRGSVTITASSGGKAGSTTVTIP